MHVPDIVIFTDLDGTLLDHHTYSWNAARSALERCEELNVPVIICSSKNRSEIEFIRKEMGNNHPFISENGGGVHIPSSSLHSGSFQVLKRGVSHGDLRKALKRIGNKTGIKVVGFSEMDDGELACLTGLEGEALERSRLREFSEPFIIYSETPEKVSRIRKAIRKSGLAYTRGGRFHHITGGNNKGRALQKVMEIYKNHNKYVKSTAIGDSLNDLPMLLAADIPILVRKYNGSHDPEVRPSGLLYADGIGPKGWNEEVMKLLSDKG